MSGQFPDAAYAAAQAAVTENIALRAERDALAARVAELEKRLDTEQLLRRVDAGMVPREVARRAAEMYDNRTMGLNDGRFWDDCITRAIAEAPTPAKGATDGKADA